MNGNFIITGGAMGFGKEFSSRVLKAGGRVVIADKNVEEGGKTVDEFKTMFGDDRVMFTELDVTDREEWRRMWEEANKFLNDKIDVLVNNAGVSPKLGFDICMKINFDGVLNGILLFEEKLGKHNGGPGGLIINIASVAGLSLAGKHMGISYWLSKHGVVSMTKHFGGPKVVYKTGIKHVALCPWFVETAIVDDDTKDLVLKKSPLKFTTKERVGDAFELGVVEQVSGGLIMVMPNSPLIYYPDTLHLQGIIVYLLSKVLQMFGVTTSTPTLQAVVLVAFITIAFLLFHVIMNYIGF